MNEVLKENIEKLIKISEERQNAFSAWLRNIITIAAGLIAVLVSLKSNKTENELTHSIFFATIGLLSLGILCGCIVLYNEIVLLNRMMTIQKKFVGRLLEGSAESLLLEVLENAWYYKPAFLICKISFLLSLIALTWYAYRI